MIAGTYSDGKTSKAINTRLSYTDDGNLYIEAVPHPKLTFETVTISPRIGNTARYIELNNGGVFETHDNDAIDELINNLSEKKLHNIAHRLEKSYALIVVTTLVIVITGWGFVQYGIPHYSREVAMLIPDKYAYSIGQDILSKMDGTLFDETGLSDDLQSHYQQVFKELLTSLNLQDITLALRSSDAIGANAFALPDGTVVFTDQLIHLAEDDLEIAAIMLHEIGHLQHRHSIRMAIQNFSLAIVIALITGDVSTSSSILTGLPIVLVESGYSREMETEADNYALQSMLAFQIDTVHAARIMQKLAYSHSPEYQSCIADSNTVGDCLSGVDLSLYSNIRNNEKLNISDYFSSHPGTAERIERFLSHSVSH